MSAGWPDALPRGYSISGYVIESVIGRGGFGITYEAKNPVLGRRVCIKEFFPQSIAHRVDGARLEFTRGDAEIAHWAVERFKVTTRALCDLSHPNIVKVFDYVPANDTGYMVMELLEGRTLSDWLVANPKPTLEQLRPVIDPVMQALAYVHEQGLIHRDVAPDNILVANDGRPVLIDFGSVSRELAQQGRASTVSTYKTFYAAPEQTTPRTVPGLSADIYSLGAVLHLAITGEPPPDSRERVGAVALGDNPDPYAPLAGKPVEGWPREALAAVDVALSLDKRKRPQSVEAFRHALRRRETPVAAQAGQGWRMAAAVGIAAFLAGAGSVAVWEGAKNATPADKQVSDLETQLEALRSSSQEFQSNNQELRMQLQQKDTLVREAQAARDAAQTTFLEGLKLSKATNKRASDLENQIEALKSSNGELQSSNRDFRAQLKEKDDLIQKTQTERDAAVRAAGERSAPLPTTIATSPTASSVSPEDESQLLSDARPLPPNLISIKAPTAGWSAAYDAKYLKLVNNEALDQTNQSYSVRWQGTNDTDAELSIDVIKNPSCSHLEIYSENNVVNTLANSPKTQAGPAIGEYRTYVINGNFDDGRSTYIILAQSIHDRSYIIKVSGKYQYLLSPLYKEKLREIMRTFKFPRSSPFYFGCGAQ